VLNGVPYMIDEVMSSSFTSCVDATDIGGRMADIAWDFSDTNLVGGVLKNLGTYGSTFDLTPVNALSGGSIIGTNLTLGSCSIPAWTGDIATTRHYKTAGAVAAQVGVDCVWEYVGNFVKDDSLTAVVFGQWYPNRIFIYASHRVSTSTSYPSRPRCITRDVSNTSRTVEHHGAAYDVGGTVVHVVAYYYNGYCYITVNGVTTQGDSIASFKTGNTVLYVGAQLEASDTLIYPMHGSAGGFRKFCVDGMTPTKAEARYAEVIASSTVPLVWRQL
jgi:hypothetical protein